MCLFSSMETALYVYTGNAMHWRRCSCHRSPVCFPPSSRSPTQTTEIHEFHEEAIFYLDLYLSWYWLLLLGHCCFETTLVFLLLTSSSYLKTRENVTVKTDWLLKNKTLSPFSFFRWLFFNGVVVGIASFSGQDLLITNKWLSTTWIINVTNNNNKDERILPSEKSIRCC